MRVISTEKKLLEVQLTTKRNSLPHWRIQTTLQKQTGIFVLVNLRVSRASATKKPEESQLTISDESHESRMSQRWLLLSLAPTWEEILGLAQQGIAAPKWRSLHSFPSACRWSLILVFCYQEPSQRDESFAAKFCKILYLWRDDRYRSSTNQSWITRERCAAVKSFN